MTARLPREHVDLDVAVLDGDVEVTLAYTGRGSWSATAGGRYVGIIRESGNAYQARSPGDEAVGGADTEEWTVALQLLLEDADVAVAASARVVIR